MIGGGRDEGCFLLPSFFFLFSSYLYCPDITEVFAEYLPGFVSCAAKALWIMACVTLLT